MYGASARAASTVGENVGNRKRWVRKGRQCKVLWSHSNGYVLHLLYNQGWVDRNLMGLSCILCGLLCRFLCRLGGVLAFLRDPDRGKGLCLATLRCPVLGP